MKKTFILLVLISIILHSCKKDEALVEIDNRLFFELPRETIVKETFEFGSISTTIDPNIIDTAIGMAYVQDGVCASIEEGYLNIGCVEPLIPPWPEIDEWRTYELRVVSSISSYLTSYPLDNHKFMTSKIGIQIDYHTGGLTEFHIGNHVIFNQLNRKN